jgi:hypothetical protein
MKMEQAECYETSAYKIQKPGNYPEESVQQIFVSFLFISKPRLLEHSNCLLLINIALASFIRYIIASLYFQSSVNILEFWYLLYGVVIHPYSSQFQIVLAVSCLNPWRGQVLHISLPQKCPYFEWKHISTVSIWQQYDTWIFCELKI